MVCCLFVLFACLFCFCNYMLSVTRVSRFFLPQSPGIIQVADFQGLDFKGNWVWIFLQLGLAMLVDPSGPRFYTAVSCSHPAQHSALVSACQGAQHLSCICRTDWQFCFQSQIPAGSVPFCTIDSLLSFFKPHMAFTSLSYLFGFSLFFCHDLNKR